MMAVGGQVDITVYVHKRRHKATMNKLRLVLVLPIVAVWQIPTSFVPVIDQPRSKLLVRGSLKWDRYHRTVSPLDRDGCGT